MKKTFKLAIACAFGAVVMFAGCSKDCTSDIEALGSRVTKLEGQVSDLQAKIDNGSVIKSVEKTANGVAITVTKNGVDTKYDITNGTNGAKGDKGDKGDKGETGAQGPKGETGAQGTPGSVVTIGPDGYWYIDNVKTDYPAQGPKGEQGIQGPKGDDGAQGPKGDDGAQGPAGKDGIYYKPCVDQANANYGKWIKVDPNTTPATETPEGEWLPVGTITAVWDEAAGAVTLHNVADVDGGVITINSISKLKSLAFIPDVMANGLGVIQGGYTFLNPSSTSEVIFRSASSAKYRVNGGRPAQINTCKDWKFINRDVKVKSVPSDKNDLLVFAGVQDCKDYIDVTFTFNPSKTVRPIAAGGDVNDIVALQTTTAEGEIITSDYAFVEYGKDVDTYYILHKNCYINGDTIRYRPEIPAKSDYNDCDTCDLPLPVKPDAVFTLNPSDWSATCDLKDFVETVFYDTPSSYEKLGAKGFNPDYKFELVDNASNDYAVDNSMVDLTPAGKMSLKPSKKPSSGINCEAAGKTPMVKVTAIDTIGGANIVLATAYIKMYIDGEHSHNWCIKSIKLNDQYAQCDASGKKMLTLLGGINDNTAISLGNASAWGTIGAIQVQKEKGGLAEHFYKYNKELPKIEDDNSTLKFTIVNYLASEVDFNPHSSADVGYYYDVDASGKAYVQFDKSIWNEDFVDHINDPNKAPEQPEIIISDFGILDPDRKVLIKVTENCGVDSKIDSAYYYVVFKSKLDLHVVADTIKFETTTVADVKDVRPYVSLADGAGQPIFVWNATTSTYDLTSYATDNYPDLAGATITKITRGDIVFAPDGSSDDAKSFGGRLTPYALDQYSYVWKNMENKLLEDKYASYTVEVEITDVAHGNKTYTRQGGGTLKVNKTK